MFACVTGPTTAAGALASAVSAPQDRGAYMSISSSLRQMAGGIAPYLAGLLVYQAPSGRMEHYPRIGLAVSVATMLMYRAHRLVAESAPAQAAGEVLAGG